MCVLQLIRFDGGGGGGGKLTNSLLLFSPMGSSSSKKLAHVYTQQTANFTDGLRVDRSQ